MKTKVSIGRNKSFLGMKLSFPPNPFFGGSFAIGKRKAVLLYRKSTSPYDKVNRKSNYPVYSGRYRIIVVDKKVSATTTLRLNFQFIYRIVVDVVDILIKFITSRDFVSTSCSTPVRMLEEATGNPAAG